MKEMKEIKLNVSGMVCAGCENRVKNALEDIEGVKKVVANYKKSIVKIKANNEVNESVLENVIEDIGFKVIKGDQL